MKITLKQSYAIKKKKKVWYPKENEVIDYGYKYNSVNACSDRTECLWYNYDIEENLFDEI